MNAYTRIIVCDIIGFVSSLGCVVVGLMGKKKNERE